MVHQLCLLEEFHKFKKYDSSATIKRTVNAQSFSCVQLFPTQWTVVPQAPLSMEFSRQKYWSGLPFPSPKEKQGRNLIPTPKVRTLRKNTKNGD